MTSWLCDLISDPQTAQIFLGLLGSYGVYQLGLRAYFIKQEYEGVRLRYLDNGLDLYSANLEYVLGIHRHNWLLLLRILKQYRDFESEVKIADFFSEFMEVDQSKFNVVTNRRVSRVLGSKVFWNAF